MATKTENDLRKVERAMNALKRKLKRADLDYNVQASINAIKPAHVIYSAQMTALANGLRPATFISHESVEDLVAQIKGFTDSLDWDKMEIAYHKGQINAAEHTLEGHKEAIEEIENKEKTEVSEENLELENPSTETDQTQSS